MTLVVSVVVPTYRRPELLRHCLEALRAQDIDPATYEVIVVDDAPDLETRRVAEEDFGPGREHSGAPAIRYLPVQDKHGPAAARNVGWRAAHAPLIAFTDDDCLPATGWLRAGVAACAGGIAGASGRIVVPVPPVPTDYERNVGHLAQAEFVTANCFYRRTALAAVGGFDERFSMAWREDSDLYFSLLERGCRLVQAPEAVVVHPVRGAPWGVSISQQRKSMFNALLYKKHPTCYRRHIQARPPWHYYRIVAALLVAVVSACGGRPTAAVTAGSLWLALTVQFCRQRLDKTSRDLRHVAEMVVTSVVVPPLALGWRIWGAIKFRVLFL